MPQDSLEPIDSLSALTASLKALDSAIAVKTTPQTFFGNMIENPSMLTNPIHTNDSWLLFVFLLILGLLAYLKMNYSKRLSDILKASYDSAAAREILRGENALLQRTSIMLLIVFLLTASSLIFIVLKKFNPAAIGNYSILSFFQILLALFLLYSLKILAIRAIGFVFKEGALTQEYTFNLFILIQVSGLLILPFAILLNYSYLPAAPIFGITMFIFLTAYIIRVSRGFRTGWNKASVSRLHLFYYFCSLELLPAAILVKFFTLVVASN